MKQVLIIVTGLPGTGKATFAGALAEATQAVHLSAENLRRGGESAELLGQPVYDKLLKRAGEALRKDRNVIVNGAFYKESYRSPFIRLARRLDADIRWIEVHATQAVAEQRLRQEYPASKHALALYRKIKDLYEPMQRSHLVLWSDTLSPDEMILRVVDFLALPA